MTVFEQIVHLFERNGCEPYLDDVVSQREHALQAAALAEAEGAPDTLVIAALLHDIGHLLPDGERHAGMGHRHEDIGQRWLSRFFGVEITEPIRLHVEAKRYLCALDPSYVEQLSPASLHSLEVQGGPHSRKEIRDFQLNPHHRDAVCLRAIDDQAKTPDLWVLDLDHYRKRLEAALLTRYLDPQACPTVRLQSPSPQAPS